MCGAQVRKRDGNADPASHWYPASLEQSGSLPPWHMHGSARPIQRGGLGSFSRSGHQPSPCELKQCTDVQATIPRVSGSQAGAVGESTVSGVGAEQASREEAQGTRRSRRALEEEQLSPFVP